MPCGKIFVEGRLQIPWPMLVEGKLIPLSTLFCHSPNRGSSSNCWLLCSDLLFVHGLAPVSRVYQGCDSAPLTKLASFWNLRSECDFRMLTIASGLALFLVPLS